MVATIIEHMSESVQELGQRHIAALWEAASHLSTDTAAAIELGDLVERIDEIEAQLAGLRLHLVHEARLNGADTVIDRVRNTVRTSSAQATATFKLATELGERFGLIAAALCEGRISHAQTLAIVSGLKKLPSHYGRVELVRAQELILEYVETLGPTELRTLASRLAEVIDPDAAEADEARRLAHEQAHAHRVRSLRLSPDFHGSVRITGQLPETDAALLTAQLDALMPPTTNYQHTGELPSREARRADALVLLTQHAAQAGSLPAHGLDRPTVHITLDLDTLTTGLGRVGLLDTADEVTVSAGEARRMACDAHLIPIVLDGKSQPLDVGRANRMFTPAIRRALLERDQGCAFPGCSTAAAGCEAHHIMPWWQGGQTTLANAVLLCPYHHRLVEPDPSQSEHSQWQVHLDKDTGLPWFRPPTYIDPRRKPRQHRRHRLRELTIQEPKTTAPTSRTPASTMAPPCDEAPTCEIEPSPAWHSVAF